jgi:hypothetical protein
MRQLYRRPSNENRFNNGSNDTKQTFQTVSSSTNENDDDKDNVAEPDHQYLIGYESNEGIKRQLVGLNSVKAPFQSLIGRYLIQQGMKLKLTKDADYGEEEYAYVTSEAFRHEALQKVLNEHITSNHPEYEYYCHLLKEYIQQGTIESLLRLYTLETPFYAQLLILSNPLEFPFFMHLSDLKQRYDQGYSYRGVCLTRHAFNEYR